MAHQLRAQSIVGFAPLVTELGGDARQLLRNAGLDPAELEQPDIYILHRAFIQLLEDEDGIHRLIRSSGQPAPMPRRPHILQAPT